MSALLEVRELYAGYGDLEIIRGISLEVHAGESVALLGPNGAGKTTLLRAISRLIPSRGELRFLGKDLTRLPAHEVARLGIAHVPEGRGILATLTVEENLELGGLLGRREGRHERLERVYSLFPVLREKRHQLAGLLSGGQQQQLAIGRALMADPKLLLLDEPSHGLAPSVVREVVEILHRIRETGTAMILVEQNVSVALRIVDRGYVIENGVVVLSGSRAQLESDERIRRAYLSI